MNSERRHELQQNDLAIYLDKINRTIEPYSKLIAIAIGALIVGGLAYGFYRSEQVGKRSEATLQLIQATPSQDAEVLLTVAENYPNTPAGDWARLYQGQIYLSQGIQALFNDKENAVELLSDAQQGLRAAIAGSNDRLLRSRGQFGIARASEALGKLDEAIEEYKKVIAINESEAMNAKAQERIDILSKADAKEFVSWFADQDFSPADPSLPPALPGSESLPDMPDLKLPPLNLGGAGESTTQPPPTTGLQLPAGDETDEAKGNEATSDGPPMIDGASETQPTDAVTSEANEATPPTNESAPPSNESAPPADEATPEAGTPETDPESSEPDSE